jgi:hypothetical protein
MLWDVKDTMLSRQSAHRWQYGCQPYVPSAALLPKNILFMLLVLILLEAEYTPETSAAGRMR